MAFTWERNDGDLQGCKRDGEKWNTCTREIRETSNGVAARFVVCLLGESKGERKERKVDFDRFRREERATVRRLGLSSNSQARNGTQSKRNGRNRDADAS